MVFVFRATAEAHAVDTTARFFLFLFIMEIKLPLARMEPIACCLARSVVVYS